MSRHPSVTARAALAIALAALLIACTLIVAIAIGMFNTSPLERLATWAPATALTAGGGAHPPHGAPPPLSFARLHPPEDVP